jgi:V/A-type H+-transporting ATPase subunit I
VFDTVFPIGLILPLIVILMGSGIFANMAGFVLNISPLASNVCLIISGVCMAGILLTAGREYKNWPIRLVNGLYALYNVLAGWLSDILSYSRLLALGLATGVIASVMNSLGATFGGGIPGLIGFVIVFFAAHALNFGINVLGAYVHANRLQFVEFFGKFYEGGGQKFAPFGAHTKNYLIKEEKSSE